MAEKGNGEDPEVNLELSFGFGRKKKQKDEAPAEPPAESAPEPSVEAVESRFEPPTEQPLEQPAEQTRPLFVDDVPATEAPVPEAAPVAESAAAAQPEEDDEDHLPPLPPKEPLRIELPGMVAAVVTGLIIGSLTVGLTWLGLRGCEAIEGTESCGGAGFFMLVAILVLMILFGSWLLKTFVVTDPGSTSFLAVGLAVVITLLFLIEVIFEWWMVIVMPLLFVATYALSHWVTVRYIEPADHEV